MPNFEFIKEQIKTFVSVTDVFDKYVGTPPNYHRRYKCPFNHEENRENFGIKGRMWHCFSCGTGGDEISLVQKLFDLSVKDAMLKIAIDFNLSVDIDNEKQNKMKIEAQRKRLQQEKDRRYAQMIKTKQSEIFESLLKRERELEEIVSRNAPTKMNIEYYGYSSFCEKSMSALAELEKIRLYIDIISESPNSIYEFELLYPAFDKQDRHERMVHFVNKIIKGELKI